MLTLPPTTEPLRVLGIDPGTTTMGIALLEWAPGAAHYTVRHAQTLVTTDNHPNYRQLLEVHGSRMARLQQQADRLAALLATTQPHVVAVEAPFMGRFAQSYGALMECVFSIHNTLLAYNPAIPLHQVDPMRVKQAAGVKLRRGTGKDDVAAALAARTDLVWEVTLTDLDEHSTDAIAVGLYYLLNLL